MDRYPDLYSHFMFPDMYRPRSARSDPYHDQNFARGLHTERQIPHEMSANSSYEDHPYHRQPRQFHGYHEPHQFPYLHGLDYNTRRAPHWHLAEPDPGCIDLRFLPAFALSSACGQPVRQQRPVGGVGHSEQGSPGRQARPTARQVPVEDENAADVFTSQFPFLLSRHQSPPSQHAASRRAVSHRSEAEPDEDTEVEQPQDLASEQQRLQHLKRQQHVEEQLLRRLRAQEEVEHRLARQAKERELQEERERRLAYQLHEQRMAEERERRLAYQHMQEQRLQQELYQRQREQELAEEEQRIFEAAQRKHCLQQRQERQRQQQIVEALLQQQRQEQEAQRQQKLVAAQQRQQLQRRMAQQAAAEHAAEEKQKVYQQQQQKDSDENMKSGASMQQPPDDAGNIQQLMRSNSVRAEHPMLERLSKANAKLNELSDGLRDVTGCASAFQAPEAGQPAKLTQCQGQLGSPEQLQKRLVELGERCMQVVLTMDELHSDNDKVRSLRKRVVKKALALMEDIDNVKSSMLHSLLVHANDDQSDFSMPVSGAVSQTSEAAEEDAEEDGIKPDLEEGAVEDDRSQNDQKLQQVADALAELKVADEAVQAPATEQHLKGQTVCDGRNDGEVHSSCGAGKAKAVENSANPSNAADTA